MDRESLTALVAQGLSAEKIGRRFGKHPSTVAYWMGKYGLVAPRREQHAAKGGIARDRLEELVAAGMSINQIAEEVGLSKGTVRHWLTKFGLRTSRPAKHESRPEAKDGKDAGLVTITMECPAHGTSEFSIEGRGYYRCRRCRSEGVTTRRRRVKAILVAEAGGSCVICGYARYAGALAFHHLDPDRKRLQISANGKGYAIDALRAEARKCVLLCANCHAEVEGGASVVPVKLSRSGDAVHLNPG